VLSQGHCSFIVIRRYRWIRFDGVVGIPSYLRHTPKRRRRHDGPTMVRCTSATAAALLVVALVDDAHLQPGHAFSGAPLPAFDAPFTFTITAPLPATVAHQIGTLPDTTVT
jgi:hypothetical protein